MAIKVRYDFKEDRMRLEIAPDREESQAFLLNRRQWLNLISAVGVTDLPPLKVPPQRPQAREGEVEPPAQPVRALKLGREEGGLRVGFLLEDAHTGVLLPHAGLPEIGELFFRQAERAGWDPAAGLDRLKAGELAQETLRKAQAPN